MSEQMYTVHDAEGNQVGGVYTRSEAEHAAVIWNLGDRPADNPVEGPLVNPWIRKVTATAAAEPTATTAEPEEATPNVDEVQAPE